MFQSTAARFLILILLSLSSITQAKLLDSFEARKAPIEDFVNWVSKQSSNNIILGRGVEGTISVHVKNLDSTEVMSLFSQVMQANGYQVIHESDFYKVIIDKAQTVNIEPLETKLYQLNYIRNTKAREVFNSFLSVSSPSNKLDEKELIAKVSIANHSVEILPNSNALLVSAISEKITALDEFVSAIDKDSKQVMIEAIIMETDIGSSKNLGINLSSALSSNGFSLVSTTANAVSDLTKLSVGGSAVYSSGGDIRGLVTALINDENTKILSTPNILVMDRERGHISVGQNVPFLVSNEVSENGNTIQQIQRKDVGISLSVTPHVLSSGQVILKINQESSSVTNSTQASDIITNKRSISTVAKMMDGETMALGGLVSEETRQSESGVPMLKDLPFIGRLFRSESKETVQRELTVLIKTQIL